LYEKYCALDKKSTWRSGFEHPHVNDQTYGQDATDSYLLDSNSELDMSFIMAQCIIHDTIDTEQIPSLKSPSSLPLDVAVRPPSSSKSSLLDDAIDPSSPLSNPYRGTNVSDGMDYGEPLTQVPNNQELHQTENGDMDCEQIDATNEQTETSKEQPLGKKEKFKNVETPKKPSKQEKNQKEKGKVDKKGEKKPRKSKLNFRGSRLSLKKGTKENPREATVIEKEESDKKPSEKLKKNQKRDTPQEAIGNEQGKVETVFRRKLIVRPPEVKKPLEKMGNDHEDDQTVIEEIEIDQTEENDVGDQNEMPKLLTVSGCLRNNFLRSELDQGRLKCCVCLSQVSLEKKKNELVFLTCMPGIRCCGEWICLECWTKHTNLTHPWSVKVRNSDLALLQKDPIPDKGPTCPQCRQKVEAVLTLSEASPCTF